MMYTAAMIEVRLLQAGDDAVFQRVAEGVFDEEVAADLAAAFLRDERHHIAAAIDDGVLVGFASGVDYIHPDKGAELWVNEVGVAPSHQRRGLGRAVLTALLQHGRSIGCAAAWVLTESGNEAANALYRGQTSPGESTSAPVVMHEFRLG